MAWRGTFLIIAGVVPAAAAAPARVQIVVSQSGAVIQETREFDLKLGEQDITLTELPGAVDLTSLVVRSGRIPLHILNWRRTAPDSDTVACRITSPVKGRRRLELSYRVAGMSWDVQYQVNVRGEQEAADVVSVDVQGIIRIINSLPRAFEQAGIRLVGDKETAAAARPPAAPGPGRVDVGDEEAFGHLVEPPAPAKPRQFAVNLAHPVNLAAGAPTEIMLVNTVRTPADRLYVIRSEQYPLGESLPRPLRKYIVFKHTSEPGVTLPPGPVRIHIGSARRLYLQDGWLPLTEPGGEIRLDLGLDPEVTGFRRSRGRSDLRDDYYEEAIEVVVQNNLSRPIRLEIDEKPPVRLKWTVRRANQPYETFEQRLYFRPRIEPRSEINVYYRLGVVRPGF
jgi:hypothetical protein